MYDLIRFAGAIALTCGLLLAFMLGVILLSGNRQKQNSIADEENLALLLPLLKVFSWLHFDHGVDWMLRRTVFSDPPRTVAPESSVEGRRFHTEREAKQYLVEQIEAEAAHQGIALTDVERKMLYFSESGWTLPGIMQVNEEFERDYDEAAYEQNIAGLVNALESRNAAGNPRAQADWDSAIVKLGEGDHYLLVLIQGAANQSPQSPWLPTLNHARLRPQGDWGRLILVAVAVIAGLLLFIWLKNVLIH